MRATINVANIHKPRHRILILIAARFAPRSSRYMIDPKALDAAFGRVLAEIAALLGAGDVIAIDGKAARVAHVTRAGKLGSRARGPG